MVGGKQVLRHGPWVRIDKATARKIYDSPDDVEMMLSPSNTNTYWIFQVGYGYQFSTRDMKDRGISFDSLVNQYEFYMEPELGRYAHFWVKRK